MLLFKIFLRSFFSESQIAITVESDTVLCTRPVSIFDANRPISKSHFFVFIFLTNIEKYQTKKWSILRDWR